MSERDWSSRPHQGAGVASDRPDVSVVVPTYNRAQRIPELLDALLAQQTAGVTYEILIVDNASTDATAEMVAARAHPLLQYLYEPRRGPSNARNAGIHRARADIVAFLDDDVLPAADWVRQIKLTTDAHPELHCLGGRIEPRWPMDPPAWLTPANYAPLALQFGRGSGKPLDATNASGCLVGANFVCRRDVLREMGGFSRDYLRDEDRELNLRLWRAGKTGLYSENVVATALVQPERLTKRYHRQWHVVTGANHARLRYREIIAQDGRLVAPITRHTLLGTPGFVYKEVPQEALRCLWHWIGGREAPAFAAECRVRYLVSYILTRAREHFAESRTYAPRSSSTQV